MLDLSMYASTDTPELTEFKQRVEQVAKVYAERHGWCGEVNRALREMGIRPEPDVIIKVTTSLGLEFTVKVKPSELSTLDDAAQKAKVCRTLGALTLSGSNRLVATTLRLTPEQITDLSIDEAAPAVLDDNWWYVSSEGRVMHHFDDVPDMRRYGNCYAACGATAARHDMTRESARGDGRHCAKCETRLPRRGRRTDTVLAA